VAKAKPSTPTIVGAIVFGYHVLAAWKDAEQAAANWQRYKQIPTFNNLLRALLAEGILIEDLGLGA
jgi:hypothetical protein